MFNQIRAIAFSYYNGKGTELPGVPSWVWSWPYPCLFCDQASHLDALILCFLVLKRKCTPPFLLFLNDLVLKPLVGQSKAGVCAGRMGGMGSCSDLQWDGKVLTRGLSLAVRIGGPLCEV